MQTTVDINVKNRRLYLSYIGINIVFRTVWLNSIGTLIMLLWEHHTRVGNSNLAVLKEICHMDKRTWILSQQRTVHKHCFPIVIWGEHLATLSDKMYFVQFCRKSISILLGCSYLLLFLEQSTNKQMSVKYCNSLLVR